MSGTKYQEKTHLKEWFEHTTDKFPNHVALHFGNTILSYRELEVRANQMAHFLLSKGVNHTSHIAVLLERSVESFVSFLGILKTGATYVPIDVDYPDERINYILKDLPFFAMITEGTATKRDIHFPKTILMDQCQNDIAISPTIRPEVDCPRGQHICYIIYTSGSTGKPKGVQISHQSITHYVKEALNLYHMQEKDRVYQGLSLAFDASMEEVWMAFGCGAALIPAPSKEIRYGEGLIEFLNHHQITVLSTVPTLLASVEGDIQKLRLLIFGGETLSESLVKRFARRGLVIMNTYGPTEATVIAIAAVCRVGEPINIGRPLPGYEIHILNESLEPVANGETGELCIGGIALSEGYVSMPEMTDKKFVKVPFARSLKLYRTGDLARINDKGAIEFLGRIDSQIKLRGYRIELDEIESVLRQHPSVAQVVVTLFGKERPMLVAYVQCHARHSDELMNVKAWAREKLPLYMQPSCWISMMTFPLLPSGKINRHALPEPTSHTTDQAFVPPETSLEKKLAEVFADIFCVSSVSVEADFFYDLGGHSLLAAKLVSSLRKLPVFQNVSILDIYQCPTIRALASQFEQKKQKARVIASEEKRHVTSLQHFIAGVVQFFGCLFQYALEAWQLLILVLIYSFISHSDNSFELNAALSGLIFFSFPIFSMVSIIALKWLLVGRIKPGKYPLWGWFYLRFWLVMRLHKSFFMANLFLGTPLISLYHRLMGAKIGRNTFIGTTGLCVHDVISIGAHTTIAYDAKLTNYVIENGWLKIGTIAIGDDAYVGARSVLSPDTVIEEGGKLGDMSLLPSHHIIPRDAYYAGSPAVLAKSSEDTRHFEMFHQRSESSWMRRFFFGVLHYIASIGLMMMYSLCYLPAFLLMTSEYGESNYWITVLCLIPIGAISLVLMYGLFTKGLKQLVQNKRVSGTYRLNSMRYLRQWIVMQLLDNNIVHVMADTLYLPWFLRKLGAKIGARSEMGETPHMIPDLVTLGEEAFTASSVALAWPKIYHGMIAYEPSSMGRRAFIGNMSLLPGGRNLGDGSLLGCLSLPPNDNRAIAAHTSWLGSPPVFLPKREMACCFSDAERFTPPKKLIFIRLAIEFVRIVLPSALMLTGLYHLFYILNLLIDEVSLSMIFMIFPFVEMGVSLGLVGLVILLKWLLVGRVTPDSKPIWNIFIWKNDVVEYLFSYFVCQRLVNFILGTPFMPMLLRLFGAKVGEKTLIDTAVFTEFDLITIGDEVYLNDESVMQTHLYEDRIFKMSTLEIGSSAHVGARSVVLYDTVMAPNAVLGHFSLLMKGENLPAGTRWEGIPAQPAGMCETKEAAKAAASVTEEVALESRV